MQKAFGISTANCYCWNRCSY